MPRLDWSAVENSITLFHTGRPVAVGQGETREDAHLDLWTTLVDRHEVEHARFVADEYKARFARDPVRPTR